MGRRERAGNGADPDGGHPCRTAGRSFSLLRLEEMRVPLEDALERPVDLDEIDSFRAAVRDAFERENLPVS